MNTNTQKLLQRHAQLNQAVDRALARGQDIFDPALESLRVALTDTRHRLEALGVPMVLKRRANASARTL